MDRVIYALALAAVTTIRALPLPVCFAIGQALGAVGWLLLWPYRKLAIANLTRAFGSELSRGQLIALSFRHFTALGANFCSAFKAGSMSWKALVRYNTFEGGENLPSDPGEIGRGVVLTISHLGNWELIAQLNRYAEPRKTGTIYQAIRNRNLNDLVNQNRRAKGTLTFDRKRDLAKALAFLRSGNLVGVLVDQHAGDAGVWTPFFGSLASTSPLAASLATRTGAYVIPLAVYTTGFCRWRTVVRPPIPYDPNNPNQLTADINRALEQQIRESPADWFWVHNRWKVPHPDFLLARTKRGIYLPEGTDPMSLKPFRILIRSCNWLGDAVMSSLAVRAIAEGRPDASITILTRDKLVDFWRTVPGVQEIIPLPEDLGPIRTSFKLRGRFDVALVFPNSARTGLEVWLAGIPRRVGYEGHNRKWMLNQIVRPAKKRSWPQHQAAHYLRMADTVGAPRGEISFPQTSTPEGPLRIGICPGAEYGPAKRWYPNRFREVMQAVADARPDATFVIVGTAADRPIAEDILRGFNGSVENLVGKTSLGDLIGELQQLTTIVTNDTGTMHLAASLGIPVVAVFGSTEPLLTGPVGNHHTVIRHQVECSPCYLRECPLDFRCMEAIKSPEVAQAVLQTIERRTS